MRRRRFLPLVAGGALASVAGCLDRFAVGTATRTAPTRTPPTGAPDTPSDAAAYPPYTSGTMAADRPANGGDPEVIGYGTVDPDTAPLYLEPDVEDASLPSADLSFTLVNRGERRFDSNFYSWGLHRFEDDRWWFLAPRGAKVPEHQLDPGETHTWSLRVSNGDLDAIDLTDTGESDLTVRGLGAGTYAFGIDGHWADAPEQPVVATARFTLEGDTLPLPPSRAVTSATRTDGTVAVVAERDREAETVPATMVLARTDADDPARFITESAIRSWPLRDALAYATAGVDRVRVEAPSTGQPPFAPDFDWPPVAYDGATFSVRVERRDGD